MEFFIILVLVICGLILTAGLFVLACQVFGYIESMFERRKLAKFRQLPNPVIRHVL